ncbi:pseudouridylate synthase [Achlya hypogyna]|uniref:Pseudouridylate synthase n=1 Tax=Achlya hypogyna TaxID=1202772 RepID=A0A1V9YQ04_ACHHY|nr:pseudouridylate synthase [Achlya hypogyna]
MEPISATDTASVGMTEFCAINVPGFRGLIKMEPEDFQVREVDTDGNVVDLDAPMLALPTNTVADAPKKTNQALNVAEPEGGWQLYLMQRIGRDAVDCLAEVVAGSRNAHTLLCPVDLEEKVALLKAIQHTYPALQCDTMRARIATDGTEEAPATIQLSLDPLYVKLLKGDMSVADCDRIMSFLLKGPLDRDAEAGVQLTQEMSKESRTRVHRLVASATACLVTKTNAANGIDVFFSPKMLKRRKRKQTTYVQFVLKKVNVDHFSALEALARTTKSTAASFTYAGTKDKRAITCQRIVAQNVAPQALVDAHAELQEVGLSLGHLVYVSGPMTLGQARGNEYQSMHLGWELMRLRFTIRIRQVKEPSATVDAAMLSLATTGFVNYFGFQRVGSPTVAVRSHHIGQALFQEDYARAIDLLFTPLEQDPPTYATVKKGFVATRDVNAALKAFPASSVTERAVLMGLKRFGATAYEKAVNSVAHHRRVMYLHAFQSFVFNVVASYRVKTLGSAVVVGDLYDDPVTHAVRVVSATEDCATLDLRHVVLPLFGSNVMYPANNVGDYYQTVLAEHGISTTQVNNLKGAYRTVFCHPDDLSWTFGDDTVALKFKLPPGAFATMLLREAMKHTGIEETA